MIEDYLDYRKQKMLGLFVIALSGLYNISFWGINKISVLSKFMETSIAGEINIASVIGVVTLLLVVAIYKKRFG